MPTPPKSAHLHVVNGNPSQLSAKELKARAAAEPKALKELRDAPTWFDEEQKAAWDYAISNAPIGLLKTIDRALLAQWCIAETEWVKAAKVVATQPQLYRDKNKDVRRNPLIFVLRTWSDELTRLGALLGFSPIARARIGLATLGSSDAIPDDPWDQLGSM